jgi:anti-sigma regulatory factor (Ser/Thr protein kinase)
MLQFEILNAAQKGKKLAFRHDLTVGDAATCNIRVHHQDMKQFHARFYEDEDGTPMVEVIDEGARMFVNGRDVMRAEVRHNDEIALGPLRLRVVDVARVSSSVHRMEQLMATVDENDATTVYDFAKEDLFYLVAKEPALRQAISFTIPSKERFIDQAQSFLARMIKNSGAEESQIDAFMTCAKELILNAHRHGHAYHEAKIITIAYRDTGERVKLTITDQGRGFDHRSLLASVRNKDAAQAARERYQAGGFGGLGFQLITRLAPDLAYNEPGNQVSFSVAKKAVPKT